MDGLVGAGNEAIQLGSSSRCGLRVMLNIESKLASVLMIYQPSWSVIPSAQSEETAAKRRCCMADV